MSDADSDVRLRNAHPSDTSRFTGLHSDSMLAAGCGSGVRSVEAVDSDRQVRIVERAGRAIGYLVYFFDTYGVRLCRFFLEDSQRRGGIGARVIGLLLKGEWRSAPSIYLDVPAGDESALEFWEDCGFAPASLRMLLDRRDNFLPERACGVVVYKPRRGGFRYLLIQQHDGNWGFPKGHMDRGESERETALRESFEETGVRVTLLDDFHEQVTYVLPSGVRKWVTYFLGRAAVDSEVARQQEEIADFAWLGYRKARRRLTFLNTRRVLDSAHNRLRQKT